MPASWIEESWIPYTEGAWYYKVGDNFDRTAYGYQWWIIDAGPHTYYLAWGHGGQQIAVLPELDMVIVVTADPLFGDHGGSSWGLEKANLNLVANFATLRYSAMVQDIQAVQRDLEGHLLALQPAIPSRRTIDSGSAPMTPDAMRERNREAFWRGANLA